MKLLWKLLTSNYEDSILRFPLWKRVAIFIIIFVVSVAGGYYGKFVRASVEQVYFGMKSLSFDLAFLKILANNTLVAIFIILLGYDGGIILLIYTFLILGGTAYSLHPYSWDYLKLIFTHHGITELTGFFLVLDGGEALHVRDIDEKRLRYGRAEILVGLILIVFSAFIEAKYSVPAFVNLLHKLVFGA